MQGNTPYIAGLYLRLSKDDENNGESVSIGTQRGILSDFCQQHGYEIYDFYIDDGYSGMNFNRPGFRRLLEDIERGVINMVVTKDLSRLGRDYIMTGYYSEIFFPLKNIRYIALADGVDSLRGHNEIAPFKNILNDMYARDLSKKVKNAKHQRAKQGLFIGSQAPYGYCKDPNNRNHLVIDPEAAETIRTIFSLANCGMGNITIAAELKARNIAAPSAYKYQNGDKRFARYATVEHEQYFDWCAGTVGQILNNRVYIGELISLKTETINCKTKKSLTKPDDQRVITPEAHEAIVSEELFQSVKRIREQHSCPANARRENLFRGKLFCECCGHPLTISKKRLKYQETDIYLCMYHYLHPEICHQTHRVYHDMLYTYVLRQIQELAKSMRRRKINSSLKEYASIEALTPEILNDVIERIEISHVARKSKPGSVIHIYWKLS